MRQREQQVQKWNVYNIQGLYSILAIKKQTSTAISTAEGETNSVGLGLIETSWLRDIIGDIMGQPDSKQTELVLDNDNQGCLVNLDSSPYKHENRYLRTKFHWIREEIRNGSASMWYELTNSMPAERLTKALDHIKHLHFCKMIGLEGSEGSWFGMILIRFSGLWRTRIVFLCIMFDSMPFGLFHVPFSP